jgi:hypothetical protein
MVKLGLRRWIGNWKRQTKVRNGPSQSFTQQSGLSIILHSFEIKILNAFRQIEEAQLQMEGNQIEENGEEDADQPPGPSSKN